MSWSIRKIYLPHLPAQNECLVKFVTLWGAFCNHYLTMDHIHSMSVDQVQLETNLFFFPLSLTSSVPHVFALSLNECLSLLPLPPSIPPAVSTPTLASLHIDPAGHNDDKSAQIFMSIEIHFGSAHSSLSVLSFFLRFPLNWSPHL